MTYVLVSIGLVVLWLLRGGSGGRPIRVGATLERFEARLKPQAAEGATWMASGRAHHVRQRDGRVQFDVHCTGLRINSGTPRIPAGGLLQLVLDDELLSTIPVRNGRVQLTLRSDRGEAVPSVRDGSLISVHYAGVVLLEGTFAQD